MVGDARALDPVCPESPHVHLFEMACYRCGEQVEVVHDCGFNCFLDLDSPTFDASMVERRRQWLLSFDLPMAPSQTSGELGVVCSACGALQGAFFIMEAFLEICYDAERFRTLTMP